MGRLVQYHPVNNNSNRDLNQTGKHCYPYLTRNYSRRRYPYFDIVVGLAWPDDPECYAGGKVATGMGSHAGQVKGGDDPDKKGYPGPPGWVLGVGLTIPPCKTWICLETSTEASEDEEGWRGHGPKMG
jgi:hypothetical protein